MGCRFDAFSGKVESVCRDKNAYFNVCACSSRKTGATFTKYAPRRGPQQPKTARPAVSNRGEPEPATAAKWAHEVCTGCFRDGSGPEIQAKARVQWVPRQPNNGMAAAEPKFHQEIPGNGPGGNERAQGDRRD